MNANRLSSTADLRVYEEESSPVKAQSGPSLKVAKTRILPARRTVDLGSLPREEAIRQAILRTG